MGGRASSPPGSPLERRVSSEEALLGREFGKSKSGVGGMVEKAAFHQVGWWKWFNRVNLFSLEKLCWMFKGKTLSWAGEGLWTPRVVSYFYLVLLMKRITVSLSDLTLSGFVASWEIFHSQSFLIYFLASLLYVLTMVQSLLILDILFYSAISTFIIP